MTIVKICGKKEHREFGKERRNSPKEERTSDKNHATITRKRACLCNAGEGEHARAYKPSSGRGGRMVSFVVRFQNQGTILYFYVCSHLES